MRRSPGYYLAEGIDLRVELRRLCALPVFAGGRLAEGEPQLKIRRASQRPNRLGFAVPSQYRLSVTVYPGASAGDLLETLLHELVHLHVGRAAGAHAWHGEAFKRCLARAMTQAYGVGGRRPRNTRHGVYAAAIDRIRRERGEQMALELAA